MAVSKWRTLVCGTICCLAAATAASEDTGRGPAAAAEATGPSRLQELLARQLTFVRSYTPAWIRELSFDRIDPAQSAGEDQLQLVLQQDRPDGTDLLTLRYPLAQSGAMRAYAGAGLNQSVYFADELGAAGPLSRRNHSRSIGAAAELGAEYRASERLLVGAGLRWAALDADAVQLASDTGVVGADEFSAGVSLGWRFR
jgi:hypothetical protein